MLENQKFAYDIKSLTVEALQHIKKGQYITFGAYEQDNNTLNGKEAIEWLVLDVKDGKALVISKYALDYQQYDTHYGGGLWNICSLRKWLNNDFINTAFSAEEKAMIPIVEVSADRNRIYHTNAGKATQDQVFLLSIKEVNQYFGSDSERQCESTDYAIESGARQSEGTNYQVLSEVNCKLPAKDFWWWMRRPGYFKSYIARVNNNDCWWWLRTPGYTQNRAALVKNNGDIAAFGFGFEKTIAAVRPALWINLNL